ncbi:hypothetical protein ASPZODRAFT_137045 [Penicilliopsis zonata CBS 506.65]|uniref:CENP-V/GFA domain-containing protein n=1 Tax=Penicilliopsis zonata CBS 506.65 TaxID=1073090 RepID=A0A1L9S6B1_9EURO|nr:hypothetical protein ASPZODRAFT_137045 [Penicilliopsis zonata CBS 506.65]OJJ42663.1 hypothetical protein ASPZODRAFT_137045 [Penicilliopsis zonata CBS 506.65]
MASEVERAPPTSSENHVVWKTSEDAIEKVPFTGSCHCGAVQFSMLHEPLTKHHTYHIPVKSCNCSICARNGYLTIFVERHEIEWISGWEEMARYQFTPKHKEHRFCGTCGSSVCIDFLGNWAVGDVIGINVRMLHGVDLDGLFIHKKNGAAI